MQVTGFQVGLSMIFRGSLWQALLAAEYYLIRVDGDEQRASAHKIYKDEIEKTIKALRNLARKDLGYLSEQTWAPRPRITTAVREDFSET